MNMLQLLFSIVHFGANRSLRHVSKHSRNKDGNSPFLLWLWLTKILGDSAQQIVLHLLELWAWRDLALSFAQEVHLLSVANLRFEGQ